jgi:hypothetical protein
MADSWTISVSGRVYGPYSLAQMQSFHAEGRLADHSMVARAGEDQFHPAREDTQFASLFSAQPSPAPAAAVETPKFGRGQPATSDQPSHFVIVAEMKSRSIAGLEEEIFSLGQAQRFMPQAWVLVSDASLNAIRNALVQKLGKLDTLFIADASHDKACWFNFGLESDARVRGLWQRAPEPQAKRA